MSLTLLLVPFKAADRNAFLSREWRDKDAKVWLDPTKKEKVTGSGPHIMGQKADIAEHLHH